MSVQNFHQKMYIYIYVILYLYCGVGTFFSLSFSAVSPFQPQVASFAFFLNEQTIFFGWKLEWDGEPAKGKES